LEQPLRIPNRSEINDFLPTAAVWEVTLGCNLRCKLCGSRAGPPRRNELNTSEAFDLIRQLSEIGVRDIGLIGGEVYYRKDWLDIISEISRVGMQCSLQTGGRGWSRKMAQSAKQAGVSGVGISIDGLRVNHDLIRGVPGSFEQALSTIRILKEVDVPTSVSTQLWSNSLQDLLGLLPILASTGVKTWQLQLSVAMGGGADNSDYLLQPNQMLDVFALLSELYDKAASQGIKVVIANNLGYFGPYEAKLRSVENLVTHWDSCSAGRNSIGIESDGKIKGCPSLSSNEYTGANIRDMSLQEIWDSTKQLSFARNRNRRDLWGFCKTCYYADVCLGGCTWTAHSLFGIPGNNPYCHHRALALKAKGLRECIKKIKPAPGQPFDNGIFELLTLNEDNQVVTIEPTPDNEVDCVTPENGIIGLNTELLLCASCEQFALPHETKCPFCSNSVLETTSERKLRNENIQEAMRIIKRAIEEA
jgi:radical SAM protein with 4Fe4S-binding SPASM domain